MTLPHEIAPDGAAAALAVRIGAALPVLDTPRTRLRVARLTDLPAWYAILCSDRSVYMDGPLDPADAFTEFAASVGSWLLRGFGLCTIEARATGQVLGFVSLNMEPSDREPELGYFVLPEAEGRGLAAEAAGALRDWAAALPLPALVSYVDPDNPRSSALAARLGAWRDRAAEAEFDGTPDAGVQVWRHLPREGS